MLFRSMTVWCTLFVFFFFNDTATTEIYTLSLHDALPIPTISPACTGKERLRTFSIPRSSRTRSSLTSRSRDRKSTRLNSSHGYISYAVFCLKKKKKHENILHIRKKKKKKNT